MNDDKFLLLFEKISEISERTARIEVQTQNLREDMSGLKSEDERQNALLAEHIRGVKAVEGRLELEKEARKDLETRIESLEEVPSFFKTLRKILVYIAGVGAALLAIYKWFNH